MNGIPQACSPLRTDISIPLLVLLTQSSDIQQPSPTLIATSIARFIAHRAQNRFHCHDNHQAVVSLASFNLMDVRGDWAQTHPGQHERVNIFLQGTFNKINGRLPMLEFPLETG
jgi:hypothetical protein